MSKITDRFSNPFTVGGHTAWQLKGSGTQIRLVGNSHRVLFRNGNYMMNNAMTAARTFKTLEKAMIAAIEHAGG